MAGGQIQSLRVFVSTWNVGGQSPRKSLDLDDFLRVNNQSAHIYVLGFQEIVPLNAGNVLVVEDSEPATKWLALINRSLNRSPSFTSRVPLISSSLLFQKSSLKKVCKSFRTEKVRKLKSCSCIPVLERKSSKDLCLWCPPSNVNQDDMSSEEDDDNEVNKYVTRAKHMKYSLIVGKQMVGIFLTVWMRKELVPYVSHLRVSYVGRGIMGCFGNKGCISVSMCLYQTSLCFLCSHLASGEKEGDELRRNLDVIEILKNTQFPRICRSVYSRIPEKIVNHDRVIWLGDLNYRIALSFSNAKRLLEMRNWETLFDKDQLKIEREAGRVFKGWREGKIYFAPTYKFSYNSDNYTLDSLDNKTKRRIPAWCDRILWHGNGIHQLSYTCGESRFSDHRPVIATFMVDVTVVGTRNNRQGSFRL